MNVPLSKAGLEGGESAADKVSKMLKRFNERLTLNNPRLVERYVKSEMYVLLALSIRGVDEKFVALFQGALSVRRSDENAGWLEYFASDRVFHLRDKLGQVHALVGRTDSHEHAVLVDVVKPIEYPELMPIPSLVRLGSAKGIYGVLPQALYYSLKEGFVILGSVVDRKVELGVGVCSGDHQVQLSGQMIEGSAEVLNCISGDHGEIYRNLTHLRNVIDGSPGLCLYLTTDGIGVSVDERHNSRVHVSDVLLGPFNFDVNPSQFLIGAHA